MLDLFVRDAVSGGKIPVVVDVATEQGWLRPRTDKQTRNSIEA